MCSATFAAPVHTTMHQEHHTYNEIIDYQLQWMGIPLGKAHIQWQERERFYSARLNLETTGVASIFNTQRRILETSGRIARTKEGLTYYPEKYHNLVQYKKKNRNMDIWFDHDGRELRYEVTPPDDRTSRPEVENTQRDTALDILTAIIHARQHIINGKEKIDFTVFDARRLTGIHLQRMKEKAPLSYLGSHTPDAGYTPKELKEFEEDEPDVIIEFADKESLFPSRAYATTLLGTIEAVTMSHQLTKKP